MFLIKLLFKNAFRHKLRTSLTILGITIAILAFGLLRTVVSAWYAGVEASSANRLITRTAISLVFMLPSSYRDKIRQIEGVQTVSWGNWFGGIYIDEKNFFPNFAIDPKTYLDLYPEYILTPEEKHAFLHDRKACIVGRLTAQKYGWKVIPVFAASKRSLDIAYEAKGGEYQTMCFGSHRPPIRRQVFPF